MKNSFVLYTSYQKQISLLTMEQRGILLTAIMCYSSEQDLPDMDGITSMAFSFIKADLDRDAEKYAKTCEARKEAGKKGGRPKTDEKANAFLEKGKKANGFSEKQKVFGKPEYEYEDDNEDEYEDDKESYVSVNTDTLSHRRVIEAWNNQLSPLGITPVRAITANTKRQKMLSARIKQYGLDDVFSTIELVKECSFLHGAKWFNFDWFIRPENYQKIRDGNYKERPGKDRLAWIDEWAGTL